MDRNYFILGEAGTGKDTVAAIMRLHNYETLALADPIREEYVRFFGTDDYKLNREKMIDIAESYKKIYGQDVWCREAVRRVEANPTNTMGFVITDGRYQHEYDYFVRERGFTAIWVTATFETRMKRLMERDGDLQTAALEFEKKHFIYDFPEAIVLYNNGSIEELTSNLRRIIL